jgi:hypothetical protein
MLINILYCVFIMIKKSDTKRVYLNLLSIVFVLTVSLGFVSASVVINEFVSSPTASSGTGDWIELFNAGSSSFSLNNCKIKDSVGSIATLSGTLQAGGYKVVDVGTRLNKDGDMITFECNDQVIDEVFYGSGTSDAPVPRDGESTGRWPNGQDSDNDASDFFVFSDITRGGPNFSEHLEIPEEEEEDERETRTSDPTNGPRAGIGIGVQIETEDFEPMVWMCGDKFDTEYECFIPMNQNSPDDDPINFNSGETPLQTILDDEGYTINVTTDQTDNELWSVISEVEIEVLFIDKIAANKNAFGYYFEGDIGSFVPLFEVGNHPNFSAPQANNGDTFNVMINTDKKIGFAIHTFSNQDNAWYTENNLNSDNADHAVVYDLTDEFVIGFEDLPDNVWDYDYQDMVVSVKRLQCVESRGRVVLDDDVEPGRHNCSEIKLNPSSYSLIERELCERKGNYAFEGESITWDVLVFDKNGIEKIRDVFVTIGTDQGSGNDIEANCILDEVLSDRDKIRNSCNARILEEELDYVSDNTAAYYTCILTIETPESMYGEYFITVEAEDLDGLSGTMDENEYWFLNPVIALEIDGDLAFENVRPGTMSYSDTIIITNDADSGSGVILDMFISGTDFYDSSSSGAKCPVSNSLDLENFRYFATNGAYSTVDDGRSDVEGYVPIMYGIGFNDPTPFYNSHEIIQTLGGFGGYYFANHLTPGSDMALTFRLDLPEPCNGDFDTGDIFFWGEAI